MDQAFKAADAPSLAERFQQGKALRKQVSRSSHAVWKPAEGRPDPISVLQASNSSRLPQLVPIRYSRMLLSPFAFLRGSALIMAGDLATTPSTGLNVQLCGDAHLSNFGIYATPERHLVFDINDFDETLPGPWEWDVKRLAASIVVAGQALGQARAAVRRAVIRCVQTYRERMWTYAYMRPLDLWYAQISVAQTLRQMHPIVRRSLSRELDKARQRTAIQAFPKLAEQMHGQCIIKDEPPFTRRIVNPGLVSDLKEVMQAYAATLPEDRRQLLREYRLVDFALKVVGVGSVGTRCYIALLLGEDSTDPLFLQIKEAQASVLEAYLKRSRYDNHAQRVVCGQQLIQGASDIFLGWTSSSSHNFYVRQLRDMSRSPHLEHMSTADFISYTSLCGWALARAHARSGDAARISGYLGKNDVFDQAIAIFARKYAIQVERDHAALVKAVSAGRVAVSVNEEAPSTSSDSSLL
ncbi:DUF2252 domain-containing protein [Ktedonosporobacter rubrisoli]|uniref:DUF2252 domain-containing protein n=1 Tax=Ktedonosporobacter rubrisoli TaxID=2509675 RepID=A0A4P6JMB9_KTERU|nr:DUF2252 domain-containing protein [Ktedonosporobacter rubrisoli]QBD76398.1 DUF2252 domain-containing protein [Ktedonosporobacter rubrisoli]